MDDGISPADFEAAEGLEAWRVLGEGAFAHFHTDSFAASLRFVQALGELEGIGDHPPAIDVREDGVTVRVITTGDDWWGMSRRDVTVAQRVSAVARELGLATDTTRLQHLLVIPGAPDDARVMPFWEAVLGYERRPDSPEEDLVDPGRRDPSFWFEAMDEPRPGGLGAIHLAVWVSSEEAETRVAAALAAGGRLVRDRAPSWWTLADPAGNEVDVATSKGRG